MLCKLWCSDFLPENLKGLLKLQGTARASKANLHEWGVAWAACVTRRKLQTPGNAEEHKKKQETPTINPIGPTAKPHRPRTKHYRKDSLGDA